MAIAEKWFGSDWHLFHTNILKFVDDKGHRIRPFSSLEEMHEMMLACHNSVVKEQDYYYHLGDCTFQYHGAFNNLIRRFNGKKRLIIGNHDKIWNPALIANFEKADLWKGFKEGNFTCSHMPLPLDSLRDGAFNVHGHTHEHIKEDRHYINVCVEPRNYMPVHYDQILMEIRNIT